MPTSPSPLKTEPLRHVRLFRNGANQAVRIPREFEFAGTEAVIWQEGNRLVIEAATPQLVKGSAASLLSVLANLPAANEDFPDVDAGLLPLDDVAL